MAGRGPAPKSSGQRRRRNEPARGEWVDLQPLDQPVLGVADKEWSPAARRLWAAWRTDPVTAQYGPADLAAIGELARQYEDLAPNEQRLRMDGLGLTPKGRRDLRFRIVAAEPEETSHLALVKPLKMDDPSAA